MNKSLRVFDVREAYEPPYQVPAIDTLDGFDIGVLAPPSDAPVIVFVVPGEVLWRLSSDTTVTGYRVERVLTGTIWEVIGTVGSTTDRLIDEAQIVAPAYYRVRAFNPVGNGPASNVVFLAVEAGGGSSGISS